MGLLPGFFCQAKHSGRVQTSCGGWRVDLIHPSHSPTFSRRIPTLLSSIPQNDLSSGLRCSEEGREGNGAVCHVCHLGIFSDARRSDYLFAARWRKLQRKGLKHIRRLSEILGNGGYVAGEKWYHGCSTSSSVRCGAAVR
ncbi:hypothetical protein BDM02DRAFT_943924 [Thelephora ganbajun]|uniref:Uncharacterized protein n=1 Tax=Thelephora ganbajun TaxID=370292 RepID=A0ACB6Z4Q5_THEGA|nr:hypothetical protein BDM02DRAFT_943924 [Thelephora ganbajun]